MSSDNCTLFHILYGCKYSLQSGRYNWRHDQTLKAIANDIMSFIEETNQKSYIPQKDTYYMTTIKFRTADCVTYRNLALPPPKKKLLQKANGREFLMDEEHKLLVFPPMIKETTERLGITIYSERTKTVIIIELTVPNVKCQRKKEIQIPNSCC